MALFRAHHKGNEVSWSRWKKKRVGVYTRKGKRIVPESKVKMNSLFYDDRCRKKNQYISYSVLPRKRQNASKPLPALPSFWKAHEFERYYECATRPEHGLVWFGFFKKFQAEPNHSGLNRTKIKPFEGQTKADRTEIFGSVRFASAPNQSSPGSFLISFCELTSKSHIESFCRNNKNFAI